MSKITLEPNNSGTGTFTIAAPNSNTNRTLTLPDEAGTALTDTTDLEPQVKTATNATGSAPVYACRAWVNFDGTDTLFIRDSGNVSSVTDNGTGNYIVNFATAMPDDNFCAVASLQPTFDGAERPEVVSPDSTQFVELINNDSGNTNFDTKYFGVAVFR